MNNLLAFSMENFGNGLFVFILGLLIVFFGIAVIVLVISIIGKIMSAKKKSKAQPKPAEEQQPVTIEEGLTSETVAAITAVLSAYYFTNESNCEFKIKKIKRIY